MTLLAPPARAIAQLDDPVFLRVVVKSLIWAAVAFGSLVYVVVRGTDWLVATQSADFIVRSAADVLGAVGAGLLALYLFPSVAAVIATLFVDEVAFAVERRYYPWLPPATPAPLSMQLWDAFALGIRVLALQLIGLVLTFLLPGIGVLLGWLIAAWAIGRGLFAAVAMRRMDRGSAIAAYEQERVSVVAQGGLVTLGGLVPLLNLVVPVLGIAAMVHVLHASEHHEG